MLFTMPSTFFQLVEHNFPIPLNWTIDETVVTPVPIPETKFWFHVLEKKLV